MKKTFGKTLWDVYGCDDGHSVIVVSAKGNPAMPYYFFFVWGPKGFELRGEGAGPKDITDAVFKDLKALSDADITRLHTDAVRLGKTN